MIQKIWLKIFIIIIIVAIPLLILEYFQGQELFHLAFGVVKSNSKLEVLEKQIDNLRLLAQLDANNESEYKKQFHEIMEIKIKESELEVLKPNISKVLQKQTLRNGIITLTLSLILSFLVSLTIVKIFKSLIAQREEYWARLEEYKSLERWQQIARALVHELRAPITPIKLICSSLADKYEKLSKKEFKDFLDEGSTLVLNKINQIENMITEFTIFAKLPNPEFKLNQIEKVLQDFLKTYEKTFPASTTFEIKLKMDKTEPILIDEKLIHNCLFNIIKNAQEANENQPIHITMTLLRDLSYTYVDIHNTGREIPEKFIDSIFDLNFSFGDSKKHNLGIGLTISKKIAFDHGGDLIILENKPERGVTFRLIIANQISHVKNVEVD